MHGATIKIKKIIKIPNSPLAMRDFRLLPRSRRELLFWYITQRVVVIPYESFGTTYRCHLQGTFEDGSDRLSRNDGKKLPL
jgi:hypothetical protein